MTNSYFHGIIEGEDVDETWRILHDHFEKLAREDEQREKKNVKGKDRK